MSNKINETINSDSTIQLFSIIGSLDTYYNFRFNGFHWFRKLLKSWRHNDYMFKFLAVLKKKNSDDLEIMLLDEKQQIFSIEAAERYLKQFSATHTVDFLFEVANVTTAKLSMKAVLDKYPNHPKYEQIKQKLKEVLEPFKPK